MSQRKSDHDGVVEDNGLLEESFPDAPLPTCSSRWKKKTPSLAAMSRARPVYGLGKASMAGKAYRQGL